MFFIFLKYFWLKTLIFTRRIGINNNNNSDKFQIWTKKYKNSNIIAYIDKIAFGGIKINSMVIKKGEYYFLEDKFFIIRKGKVIARDMLANGKAVANEYYFSEGEVVGNFFRFLKDEKLKIPSVEIEIEALRDSELEEFNFSTNIMCENIIFEKIIIQLIKKSTIKFLENIYNPKGYLLSILKLHANDKLEVEKTEIGYENFNMSKSQYYLKLSELKKEKYLEENGNVFKLNIKKIDNYLEMYEE